MTHMHTENSEHNESKTLVVVLFTLFAMIAEIIFGYITNSMALLADGFHMGTHAIALGLTYAAYVLIRKYKNSVYFPQGTDKIGLLAAYTSSLFLGVTGVWIIYEAFNRLLHPLGIQFNEALIVAFAGLAVNLICIIIMEHGESHKNHETHSDSDKEDYNFSAAYYHILADILTSLLAIGALFAGKYLNITCLDSISGILGGLLILKWAFGLIRKTVVELIDMEI